jgi:hypothetical protein|tara:strand:- start:1670 stop:1843 length:174 start_codon:yes stop_codon:yes gene_type:complete
MPFNDIIDIPIIRPEKVVENDYENKNTYTKQDALKNVYRAKRSNIINKGKTNGRRPK